MRKRDCSLRFESIVGQSWSLHHIPEELQRFRESRRRHRERPAEAVAAGASRDRATQHLGILGDLHGAARGCSLEHRPRGEERQSRCRGVFLDRAAHDVNADVGDRRPDFLSHQNRNSFRGMENRNSSLLLLELRGFSLRRLLGSMWGNRRQAV